MRSRTAWLALPLVAALSITPAFAQGPAADRLIRMNGQLPAGAGFAAGGTETVEFAIYDNETGGKLLWQEAQVLAVDGNGGYAVFLGATTGGLPTDLFKGGDARWLSVKRVGGAEGARSLLTAVPYALSAANADSLAGRPASDFLLTPAARKAEASGAKDGGSGGDPTDNVNNGTAGFIGKFFNTVDLDNSALYQSGSNVGVGTTTPLDALHTRFLNTNGTATGYAVQNLGNTATSYSGMLFYDHTSTLRQFQGYNNGTGEYRINNISPSGSINFMIGSTSAFLVDTTRNIGIGQPNPGYKLDILHGGSTGIRIKSSSSFSVLDIDATTGDAAIRLANNGVNQWNIRNQPGTDNLQIFELGGGGERMIIQNATGHVGIGISNPTRARLEVAEGGSFDYGTRGVLNTAGATQLTNTGTATTNSIFADGFIWSQATFAVSDARIKKVRGRSSGAVDLATLMNVKVTDYSFVDTIAKGEGLQKKVIAQELEEVYPQAVKRGRDVVPDIFAMGTMADGWVALATNVRQGDRVRLHNGDTSAIYEVLEVGTDRFRTSLRAADGTKVFVYGREVDDFRAVDYEAVSMLNVSATQELYRKIQQQESDTAVLRQELAEMRTALTAALEALAVARVQR